MQQRAGEFIYLLFRSQLDFIEVVVLFPLLVEKRWTVGIRFDNMMAFHCSSVALRLGSDPIQSKLSIQSKKVGISK